MEGSVQTEQALLKELCRLRERVNALEQLVARQQATLAETMSKQAALVLERERLQREQAEAQAKEFALLEASQRMDEFLSIASHELRTPLTTINGNIQLARRHLHLLPQPDVVQESYSENLGIVLELLNRAEHQVRIQNRLVSDLLDVSRIQSNRLNLHLHYCDLLEIVRETVAAQRAATPLHLITLTITDIMTIPIMADGDRVGQVISNYLTNALKYSPTSQPVEVSVVIIDGTRARVSVSDKGAGLSVEEQAHLWQRFYRVPGITAQSDSGVGLGLGLYICRTIIELHQGQVGVESTPGQGSTFWFTLPIAP